MVYTKSRTDALLAEDALKSDFHDITMIWSHGGNQRGNYNRYFSINRTRNIFWPMKTHDAALWPGGDPKLIFPDTIYDLAGYKKLWWGFLNIGGKDETHYIKLKFGTTGIMQRNQQCDWLQTWWTDYGVNKTAFDPVYRESYSRFKCDICFEHNIPDCFHSPYNNVKEMLQISDNETLREYMTRHYEWLVLTKIKHQIVLNKPMIVRRIFTKAWDENLYKKFRFPEITVF